MFIITEIPLPHLSFFSSTIASRLSEPIVPPSIMYEFGVDTDAYQNSPVSLENIKFPSYKMYKGPQENKAESILVTYFQNKGFRFLTNWRHIISTGNEFSRLARTLFLGPLITVSVKCITYYSFLHHMVTPPKKTIRWYRFSTTSPRPIEYTIHQQRLVDLYNFPTV